MSAVPTKGQIKLDLQFLIYDPIARGGVRSPFGS